MLNGIENTEVGWVEIGAEVLGVEFPCFAVCFVQDVAAVEAECCRFAGVEEGG